jgi:protein-tyrosine kinase
MSRNFELLQQIGREQELFRSPEAVTEPRPDVFIEPAPLPSIPVTRDTVDEDEVSALVQRLFLIPGNETFHSVAFAGTESGNGCTWLCARAAEALASRVTSQVCVVDANLRAPGMHTQMGIRNHHGLSDALLQAGPMSSYVTSISPNLSIVSCGSETEKAESLLTTNRMRARLNELRSNFDYVLIDCSALNISRAAVVLGASTDGVVLVVKANSSRKETARGAVHELKAAKVRVLGAVLNHRTFPIPSFIYDKL